MGIKNVLFGRKMTTEEKRKYDNVRKKEEERRFKELKMDEAKKRAREDAEFNAGGGYIGMFGRGVKKGFTQTATKVKKKVKEKAKKEWNKSKKKEYKNPMMPSNSFTSGVAFQPNPDFNLPTGLKKRRR